MELDKLKSIIGSLLFVSGEPLKIKKISGISEATNAEIKEAVKLLAEELEAGKQGLRLIEKDDEVQLVTDPDNAGYVESFLKSEMEQKLSRASLETLAIIAYRGPMSRMDIEQIRGVNSTFSLRYLLLRGLIERLPNPNDTRSWFYQISFDFLKKMNLTKKEDLPQYEELRIKSEKAV